MRNHAEEILSFYQKKVDSKNATKENRTRLGFSSLILIVLLRLAVIVKIAYVIF